MAAMFDNVMFGNYDSAMNLDDPGDEPATPGQPNGSAGTGVNNGMVASDGGFAIPTTNTRQPLVGPDGIESPSPSTAGAGPMPLTAGGFGSQTSAPAGNTLTEFTKRRNWPAKVVEELRDFLKILDANGRIRFVSPSILQLTGYTNEEIIDNFLKDFIHADDVGVFVAELNESIASGNPLRMFYRFRKKDGTYAIFETVGHAHIAAAKFAPNPHNQSPFCQAVFMMARPYPTKNAGLLDSFLEHKMENERLRRRIAELRREEEADNEESHKQWLSQSGRSDVTPSESMGPSSIADFPGLSRRQSDLPSAAGQQQPQQQGADPTAALTREALEGPAHNRPDSLKDKMARYEGSHTERIEMLTGLRFAEGERSKGITTGNASPSLVKGDAGIAIPVDRDPRTGDKKKKLKTSEEYVCTDCGKRPRGDGEVRRVGAGMLTFCFLQAPSTRPNGEKDPTGPRRYATPAGCGGRRRRRRASPGQARRTRSTSSRWARTAGAGIGDGDGSKERVNRSYTRVMRMVLGQGAGWIRRWKRLHWVEDEDEDEAVYKYIMARPDDAARWASIIRRARGESDSQHIIDTVQARGGECRAWVHLGDDHLESSPRWASSSFLSLFLFLFLLHFHPRQPRCKAWRPRKSGELVVAEDPAGVQQQLARIADACPAGPDRTDGGTAGREHAIELASA